MSYKHLNIEQRHYIELEHKKGSSQTEIAQILEINQSTVSREISRNTGLKGYRHKQAHEKSKYRHKAKVKQVKMTEEICQKITSLLEKDWSPEQISGRLKTDEYSISIHHETIYQYILSDQKQGGTLYKHLRHQKKTYRKRYGSAHTRNGIINRVDIDHRPTVASNSQLKISI